MTWNPNQNIRPFVIVANIRNICVEWLIELEGALPICCSSVSADNPLEALIAGNSTSSQPD